MSLTFPELIREASSTTGTADFVLTAAVAGHRRFSVVYSNGALVPYFASNSAGEREWGVGTYSANTIARTNAGVRGGTAGAGARTNFTSAPEVYVSLPPDSVSSRLNLTATTDPTVSADVTAGYSAGSSLWLNTVSGLLFRCIDATAGAARWAVVPHGLGATGNRRTLHAFEDFETVASGMRMATIASGTGAGLSWLATSGAAFGIARLQSGTAAPSRTALVFGSNTPANNVAMLLGYGYDIFEAAVSFSALSGGADTYTARVGFFDDPSVAGGDGLDGVFFEAGVNADAALTPGTWGFSAISNGTKTGPVATGVAVSTSAFQRLRINVAADGSAATAYIDGAAVATISTNIPTGAGRHTSAGVGINKVAGSTNRFLNCDFCELIHLPRVDRS